MRGDVIELFPTYDDNAYRIELWGDEVESLSQINPILGQVKQTYLRLPIYPKTHYVMDAPTREQAMRSIENELQWWHKELEGRGKLIEAQRVYQRTMFDLEMIKQIGYCHGIENYSRHFPDGCRVKLRLHCWITCRPTLFSSSTRATRRYRNCKGCTTVTARGRMFWWSMAFGCPARGTTGR